MYVRTTRQLTGLPTSVETDGILNIPNARHDLDVDSKGKKKKKRYKRGLEGQDLYIYIYIHICVVDRFRTSDRRTRVSARFSWVRNYAKSNVLKFLSRKQPGTKHCFEGFAVERRP